VGGKLSKLKLPLFSLEAHGSIGNALTIQGHNRGSFARKKPIPTDPKTDLQLAWRQVYRDAVASWNSLTAEEKEAWRNVCPGLTAYQCFMRSELKYPPPPVDIDVGADPIERAISLEAGYTIIAKDNPANASGTLHTVKIWAVIDLSGLIIGTFYPINGNTLKCRDSVFIGDVKSGAERTFTEFAIPIEAGDYIGCFYSNGNISFDFTGFAGLWSILGEHIGRGDEATYDFFNGYAVSLYGIGIESA